jgi:hypothetical protein
VKGALAECARAPVPLRPAVGKRGCRRPRGRQAAGERRGEGEPELDRRAARRPTHRYCVCTVDEGAMRWRYLLSEFPRLEDRKEPGRAITVTGRDSIGDAVAVKGDAVQALAVNVDDAEACGLIIVAIRGTRIGARGSLGNRRASRFPKSA